MSKYILEDYCSFEVSKLLKEKRFTWNDFKPFQGIMVEGVPTSLDNAFPCYNDDGKEIRPHKYTETNKHYPRPTHALAIKWIRENFGIHISTQMMWYAKQTKIAYFYLIYKTPDEELGNHEDRFSNVLDESHQEIKGNYINDIKYDKLIFEKSFAFLSSEEATEAALLHTLQNLIK